MKYTVFAAVLYITPLHAQIYNPDWNGFEDHSVQHNLDIIAHELKRSNDIIEQQTMPEIKPPDGIAQWPQRK